VCIARNDCPDAGRVTSGRRAPAIGVVAAVGYLGGPLACNVFCDGPTCSDRVIASVVTAALIVLASSIILHTGAAECARFDGTYGNRPVRPMILPVRPSFPRPISLPPDSFSYQNQSVLGHGIWAPGA
jgi:hypothetical protein